MNSEETLIQSREHWKALVGPAIIQLLLIAAHVAVMLWNPFATGFAFWDEWGPLIIHGLIVIAELSYAIVPILKWATSGFTVTSQRVVASWGILNRASREIPLDRIISVTVERDLIDRMFRCGTLVFHDSASISMTDTSQTRSGIRFRDVPNVLQVKAAIDGATQRLRTV